jgi:hypothetical protein
MAPAAHIQKLPNCMETNALLLLQVLPIGDTVATSIDELQRVVDLTEPDVRSGLELLVHDGPRTSVTTMATAETRNAAAGRASRHLRRVQPVRLRCRSRLTATDLSR